MVIREGDNFDDALKNLKTLIAHKSSDFEILGSAGAYTVLRRIQGMGHWYVLAEHLEAPELGAKPLKAVAKVLGFMSVLHLPNVDEVFSVYVDPKYRGKGLGLTLYGIAHKHAKKGLQSSDDLGSMSLGVWLSIYKREPKCFILMKGKKLPRKDIQIDGQLVSYKGQPLVGPNTPSFNFFWK